MRRSLSGNFFEIIIQILIAASRNSFIARDKLVLVECFLFSLVYISLVVTLNSSRFFSHPAFLLPG